MSFPAVRMRRLRRRGSIRELVRETRLAPESFVMPFFVVGGRKVRQEIPSMPGQYRLSVDRLLDEATRVRDLGISGVLLFGIPDEKDEAGSGAWDRSGPVCKALEALAKKLPELVRIADVCMCEYTAHGHCGRLDPEGRVLNDPTLEDLARASVAYADAGADIVAPSDMMDGRVAAIRAALDRRSHAEVAILAYAAKFASAYYGPFREAAASAPRQGDRKGYQMDPGNPREALREIALDVAEGADMVMVKPALAYLDVIARARERFELPLAAYNVSGEYSMVKAAAARGWIDERRLVLESLTGIRRAGADILITYHAVEAASWLRGSEASP